MSDLEISHPEAWISASFGRIADALRYTAPGNRNRALRDAGYRWGRIRHIANGSAEAFDRELANIALNTGLTKREVEQVLSRAIRDGREEPTEHRIAANAARGTGPKLRILRSAVNPGDEEPEEIDLREPRKTTGDDARAIWRRAQDILGTPAEAYLKRRGLEPHQVSAAVRYDRSADYHYCIFGVTNDAGEIVALQRVSIDQRGEPFVFEDGRKRKLSVGPIRGSGHGSRTGRAGAGRHDGAQAPAKRGRYCLRRCGRHARGSRTRRAVRRGARVRPPEPA